MPIRNEYDISPIVGEQPPLEEKPSWLDKLTGGLTKKLPTIVDLRVYYDEAGNELHREAVNTPVEQRYKGPYFKTKIESANDLISGIIGKALPQPSPEFKEKYYLPTAMSVIEAKINRAEELSQEELDTVDTYMQGHMIRPPGYTPEQWSKVRPATQKAYNIAMMALIVAGVTSPVWSKLPLKALIGKIGPTTPTGKVLSNQVTKILGQHGLTTKWWRALSKGAPLSGETINEIITPVSQKAATQIAKLYNITLPSYTPAPPVVSGVPSLLYSGYPIELRMVAETVNALPKFTPLADLARQMGLTIIPDIGAPQYMTYWEKLNDSQQELELQRKELLEDTQKALEGGPKEQAEITQIKSEQEKLLATTKKLPEIVPYASLEKEIAPKAGLFPEEEVEATRQMDMYRQELAVLEKAGLTGREAEKTAMEIAGKKYMKKTGRPATQLKWEFGAPTLPGQRELGLREIVQEIAPKELALTPELTTSHDKFAGLLANYEKEVDPVKKIAFAEKAHLVRNKGIAESGIDFLAKGKLMPDLTAIEYEAEFPPAKLVVQEMKDGTKIKQDTTIEKQIAETNKLPSAIDQEVYVYNLTGETIVDVAERQRQFLNLLKSNNPRAYNHLFRTALTNEEITARLDASTKEIESLRGEVDTEMEGLRDYVTPKGEAEIEEYHAFLDEIRKDGGISYGSGTRDYKDQYKGWPLSVKNKKGLDLDEMADAMGLDIEVIADKLSYAPAPAETFEIEATTTMENNINDFPVYKRIKELEEQAETLRMEALDRNIELPEPAPTERVTEKRPLPIRLEAEKPSAEFEANIEEAMRNFKLLKSWEQLEFSSKDMFTAPVTQYDLTPGGPPKVPPEQMFFSDLIPPGDLPVDIEPWPMASKDIWGVGYVRRVGDMMSDFERATKVPVYSQGFREIYDGARLKDDESLVLNATLKNIFKGVKRERRIEIGKAMEKKKATLSPEEKTTLEAIRNFYIYLGEKFNVSKERMIDWYLPHLMEAFRTGDPARIPKEFEPFFKKLRTAEDFQPRLQDPLNITRIYMSQGLKGKYFYDTKLIPNFVKHIQNQPPGFREIAKRWLAHDILRRPTKLDRAVGGWIEKMPGMDKLLAKWETTGVGALSQLTRAMGSLMYSSALGFRLASPAKNLTQQLHNIVVWGPQYWVRGMARAFTGEERKAVESLNIIRHYGIMLENVGQKAVVSPPQKVVDVALYLFMKVDAGSRRTGHGAQVVVTEDAETLLKSGAIDEEKFLKMTKFNLTLSSDQPRILEILRTQGAKAYADEVAKDLIHLTQYDYSPANMPVLFAGKLGRIMGMFTSWPIQFLEMQARFVKQGEWSRIVYYILGALGIINAARFAGIEVGQPGYPEIKIGNTRIALIPGGWFLTGSMPQDLSPATVMLYQGGKLVMLFTKGGWNNWVKSAYSDFKRASKLMQPFGISSNDFIQMFKEIESGKYGKRDKNGRLIYLSDEAEVIKRGLGFTTTQEIEKTGRDTGPKLEFKGYQMPWETKAPSCPYVLP